MMMTVTKTTIGEPSEYPWRQSSPWLIVTVGGKFDRQAKIVSKGPAVELEDLFI